VLKSNLCEVSCWNIKCFKRCAKLVIFLTISILNFFSYQIMNLSCIGEQPCTPITNLLLLFPNLMDTSSFPFSFFHFHFYPNIFVGVVISPIYISYLSPYLSIYLFIYLLNIVLLWTQLNNTSSYQYFQVRRLPLITAKSEPFNHLVTVGLL